MNTKKIRRISNLFSEYRVQIFAMMFLIIGGKIALFGIRYRTVKFQNFEIESLSHNCGSRQGIVANITIRNAFNMLPVKIKESNILVFRESNGKKKAIAALGVEPFSLLRGFRIVQERNIFIKEVDGTALFEFISKRGKCWISIQVVSEFRLFGMFIKCRLPRIVEYDFSAEEDGGAGDIKLANLKVEKVLAGNEVTIDLKIDSKNIPGYFRFELDPFDLGIKMHSNEYKLCVDRINCKKGEVDDVKFKTFLSDAQFELFCEDLVRLVSLPQRNIILSAKKDRCCDQCISKIIGNILINLENSASSGKCTIKTVFYDIQGDKTFMNLEFSLPILKNKMLSYLRFGDILSTKIILDKCSRVGGVVALEVDLNGFIILKIELLNRHLHEIIFNWKNRSGNLGIVVENEDEDRLKFEFDFEKRTLTASILGGAKLKLWSAENLENERVDNRPSIVAEIEKSSSFGIKNFAVIKNRSGQNNLIDAEAQVKLQTTPGNVYFEFELTNALKIESNFGSLVIEAFKSSMNEKNELIQNLKLRLTAPKEPCNANNLIEDLLLHPMDEPIERIVNLRINGSPAPHVEIVQLLFALCAGSPKAEQRLPGVKKRPMNEETTNATLSLNNPEVDRVGGEFRLSFNFTFTLKCDKTYKLEILETFLKDLKLLQNVDNREIAHLKIISFRKTEYDASKDLYQLIGAFSLYPCILFHSIDDTLPVHFASNEDNFGNYASILGNLFILYLKGKLDANNPWKSNVQSEEPPIVLRLHIDPLDIPMPCYDILTSPVDVYIDLKNKRVAFIDEINVDFDLSRVQALKDLPIDQFFKYYSHLKDKLSSLRFLCGWRGQSEENSDHREENSDHREENSDHREENSDHREENSDHREENSDHREENSDHREENSDHREENSDHREENSDPREEKILNINVIQENQNLSTPRITDKNCSNLFFHISPNSVSLDFQFATKFLDPRYFEMFKGGVNDGLVFTIKNYTLMQTDFRVKPSIKTKILDNGLMEMNFNIEGALNENRDSILVAALRIFTRLFLGYEFYPLRNFYVDKSRKFAMNTSSDTLNVLRIPGYTHLAFIRIGSPFNVLDKMTQFEIYAIWNGRPAFAFSTKFVFSSSYLYIPLFWDSERLAAMLAEAGDSKKITIYSRVNRNWHHFEVPERLNYLAIGVYYCINNIIKGRDPGILYFKDFENSDIRRWYENLTMTELNSADMSEMLEALESCKTTSECNTPAQLAGIPYTQIRVISNNYIQEIQPAEEPATFMRSLRKVAAGIVAASGTVFKYFMPSTYYGINPTPYVEFIYALGLFSLANLAVSFLVS